MFVALCSIPSLTSAFIFIFMPESPKFLVEVCEQHSFDVLNRLFFSVWFYGFAFFVRLPVKKRPFASSK